MTKEEFKTRWESDSHGGGITFEDIADCAKKWGLFSTPKISPIYLVRYKVLKFAECIDAEDYKTVNIYDD